MNEPIRHHYIPQFILRNFCFGHSKRLYYYDIASGTTAVKETRDVFMLPNLYRDSINHPENQTKIERDFAIYEREVAEIINDRFLNEMEIYISKEENEKLKLFLAIMGFRSINASASIINQKAWKKEFYSQFQLDGNLEDFWKRNLGYLVNCRSLQEAMDHPIIDDPIKIFMLRDAFGYCGRYITVVECSGSDEFLIGDSYPTGVRGIQHNGIPIELYSIFPISTKRAILLPCAFIIQTIPPHKQKIRESVFCPKLIGDDGSIHIRVKKLYSDETEYLNHELINSSKIGIAFRTKAMETTIKSAKGCIEN